MIQLLLEFTIIGIVGGMLGIFYRNCLKAEGLIFNWLYRIFDKWVRYGTQYTVMPIIQPKSIKARWWKFKAWIAYPLGYCIYCSTFWITMLLCFITSDCRDGFNSYSELILSYITALSVQHLVICIACRFLIHKHPDLDGEQ